MKALWLVSFRPIGKSKSNDLFQSIFVDSVKSLNCDVWFSLTQFNEANVKKFIQKKKSKVFLQIFQKKNFHQGKKYSNKIMLEKALDQYIDKGKFDYLVFSTADIVVPNNLFEILNKINLKNLMGLFIRIHKL